MMQTPIVARVRGQGGSEVVVSLSEGARIFRANYLSISARGWWLLRFFSMSSRLIVGSGGGGLPCVVSVHGQPK